jgi:hypothetical protein
MYHTAKRRVAKPLGNTFANPGANLDNLGVIADALGLRRLPTILLADSMVD